MANRKGQHSGDASLVFVALNNHDARCGPSPHLGHTDNPGLHHGYFENRYGEKFVFTFDRATKIGTVLVGDHGWDDPRCRFASAGTGPGNINKKNVDDIIGASRDEKGSP
jgi:hypothetical protein